MPLVTGRNIDKSENILIALGYVYSTPFMHGTCDILACTRLKAHVLFCCSCSPSNNMLHAKIQDYVMTSGTSDMQIYDTFWLYG